MSEKNEMEGFPSGSEKKLLPRKKNFEVEKEDGSLEHLPLKKNPIVGKDGTESPPRRGRKEKKPKNSRYLYGCLGSVLGIAVLVGGFFTAKYFYELGHERGMAQGELQVKMLSARDDVKWPPEVTDDLDVAFAELRQGQADSALQRLKKWDSPRTPVSSVTYLVALAAMQSGDIDLAEQKARESIDKQERISDSLALLGVLETQKATRYKLSDPSARSEEFLRQAILADVANPYPRYELATLLRYKGRRDEAIQQVQAAQARLNPIDSHMVMDVTLGFMRLEALPVEKLSDTAPDTDDVRKLFPAAYAAMRRGNFEQSATLLKKCREALPSDVFDYLINDPALRKYMYQAELRSFFGV